MENIVKTEQLYEGKAKKVFATNDPDLVIVDYKDDATAFNGEKKGTIVGKGAINNKMTNYMFKLLEKEGIPTHLVEEISDRETIVKKVEIVPLEVIVRNVAAGSFSKKLGIEEGTKLKQPTLEFSYKCDELGDPFINKYYVYLLLICLVSAMGGLLFGYDWVVIGGAKIFYESFFGLEGSAALRGWAMSSALIGCLAGALLSGEWSDKYGRKKMLVIASFLFVWSAYGTGAVDSFTWFILYRIIGGFGIGIASNVSPVYIAEVAPASVRGKFVSLNQLTVVLGILMAQLANWQIGEYFTQGSEVLSGESVEWAWRWMFWAELVPAGLFFVLSFTIPESPRWLAMVQKQPKLGVY